MVDTGGVGICMVECDNNGCCKGDENFVGPGS